MFTLHLLACCKPTRDTVMFICVDIGKHHLSSPPEIYFKLRAFLEPRLLRTYIFLYFKPIIKRLNAKRNVSAEMLLLFLVYFFKQSGEKRQNFICCIACFYVLGDYRIFIGMSCSHTTTPPTGISIWWDVFSHVNKHLNNDPSNRDVFC